MWCQQTVDFHDTTAYSMMLLFLVFSCSCLSVATLDHPHHCSGGLSGGGGLTLSPGHCSLLQKGPWCQEDQLGIFCPAQ